MFIHFFDLFFLDSIIKKREEYQYVDDPNKIIRNTDCLKNAFLYRHALLKQTKFRSANQSFFEYFVL